MENRKSVREEYRLLFADVMLNLQREVSTCYGGGPVKGSRPGSGSNFSTTAFHPDIKRDNKNLTATIIIWRARGTDAAGDEARDKRRAMYLVDIKGSGDGRSRVTVFGPKRGRNEEIQAFHYWAGGGKGQCVWH